MTNKQKNKNGMNVTKELLSTKKNINKWKRNNLSAMMNSLRKIKQVKKKKKNVATLTSVIGDIANIMSKIIANIMMDGNHP
jgi:hypothetical protein